MNAPSNEAIQQMDVGMLIDYIVKRFHAGHRSQLPELIQMARRVEHVHANHPQCPEGLADVLEAHLQEIEAHMLKEEKVLFPMLSRSLFTQAGGPISVMLFEHEQHLDAIKQIRGLTQDLVSPSGACNTWRRQYEGLADYAEELSEHIHTENEVLFPKAGHAAQSAEGGHDARV